MLKKYFEELLKTSKTGDATEASFYAALKNLIERLGSEKKRKFIVTTLPKKTEAGNPDFRIWDGKARIIGYIEAKAPTIKHFELADTSEQLKRYRHTFPNLILTNFFEFRLYRNGELINQVLIGRPFVIHKLKTIPPVENAQKFLELLEQFFSFSTPKTSTAKALALELAKRTRFLRDNVIAEELKEEQQPGTQTLEAFYKAFKDHLIATLKPQDFADLFAQTITYGLFAARSRAENSFNRKLAFNYIPRTIGILRDVFRFISSSDLPRAMEWIIDDIAEVLAVADVKNIIHGFTKEGKGRDPIVHFYETFLAEYDPKMREKRGVYYTPESVVGYIVRSLHKLLKEKFGKEDGFATQSVTVLDPAAGTLTFPAEAMRLSVDEYKKKYGEGGVRGLIKDHILENFYAFELMIAPYAVGHLNASFVLEELGRTLESDERFKFYLTNTLEFTKEDPKNLPGFMERTIAQESGEAMKVKTEVPIMVIMGNPPYSGVSENKGEWILNQIKVYRRVDGKPLGERKDWLQDDYVKFFRFAQWKIEQTGQGILGFITNHAWLDNPTFRGMRASLLKTFDEVYILNLHGSTLKKEKTPEGGKDENVFDIQPGVAIAIFVKSRKGKPTVTLDTNCIETRSEPELEAIEKLEKEGKITLFISSVTERELRNHTIWGINVKQKKKDYEVGVWGESEWGNAVFGGDDNVLEKILKTCFPEFPQEKQREDLTAGQKRQLRDVMILEGHLRNKRDFFITKDVKGFIKDGKRERLLNQFGVEICTPQEFLDQHKLGIYSADLWGLREKKYEWLDKRDIASTKWQPLMPTSPYYFFVPREEKGREEYEQFSSIPDIFTLNSTGIVTARDHFVIDHDRNALMERIRIFRDSADDDKFIQQALELKENYAWRISKARQEFKQVTDWEKHFTKILYRPFDERWIYYHPSVVWRTRDNVMQHLLRPNLALITSRMTKGEPFQHALVSQTISEVILLSSKTSNNAFVFPLYLYSQEGKKRQSSLLYQGESPTNVKKSNIDPELFNFIEHAFKRKIVPDEILHYIYAILYSNVYRKKYVEFLKIDFPRVPFTKDYKLFEKLAELGERLVGLHLLKIQPADNWNATQLQGRGESKVEKVEWRMNELWISEDQRFIPIPEEVWNYHIGGYQVLAKWLKDRKGRTLNAEEVKQYCRIVTALKSTIEIQREIDKLYPGVEKSLVDHNK